MLCLNCEASQIVNEGYISLAIPHIDCAKKCVKLSVTKNNKPYIKHTINQEKAFTLSGLSDGEYQVSYYSNKINSPIKKERFTVKHHALSKAFTVFIIGAILFCALIFRLLKIKQEE